LVGESAGTLAARKAIPPDRSLWGQWRFLKSTLDGDNRLHGSFGVLWLRHLGPQRQYKGKAATTGFSFDQAILHDKYAKTATWMRRP